MARDENMIAALKRERAVYVSQGADDRVRQVDESLKYYGYEPESGADGDGPRGRTAAPQSTAARGKAPSKRAEKKTAAPQAQAPTMPGDTPPAE